MDFIDTLAFNYHWSKDDILDKVCLDEAIAYSKMIRKRKVNEHLTQLAIISNPHAKTPKELFNLFKNELRKLEDRGIIDDEREPQAMEKLKQIFNSKK